VKSKPELIAENALLRQQVKQPKLTSRDRGLLVLLASQVPDWKNALLFVKPDTVLKWHRQGFKLFWRHQSKGNVRKPRLSEETIALIKQMALENRRWGTKRIRGELLKLGKRVNKGTIRRYMFSPAWLKIGGSTCSEPRCEHHRLTRFANGSSVV
jgi:hypothetical protein